MSDLSDYLGKVDKQRTRAVGISWLQLLIVGAALSLGFWGGLLFLGTETGQATTLSTIELIGFMLSVFVAGASIVLAIAAISLGKSSEHAVMRRTDESIRLQNEIFVRTTDALQRIESSTGVTEKRIEDIIAGRVGDISDAVAAQAKSGTIDRDELEKSIRESLLESIQVASRPSYLIRQSEERQLLREKRAERQRVYMEQHNTLQLKIANMKDVDIIKMGHGSPSDASADLFDGVYKMQDRIVAMSTWAPLVDMSNRVGMFIVRALREMPQNNIDKCGLFFFVDDDHDGAAEMQAFDELVGALPVETRRRFKAFLGSYEDIDSLAASFIDFAKT